MNWPFKHFGICHRLIQKPNHLCARSFQRKRKAEQASSLKVGVVGSGSIGDPANLAGRTFNSGYLFNCGDGTFRLMSSRGHRFRYVGNVFCTRSDWTMVGGIPSLARAIWDKNSLFPTFHGPPAIRTYLDQFAILTDLDPMAAYTENQFNQETYFEDNCISIDFVDLFPANDSGQLNSQVMAFICRVKPREGKINLKKFTDLNLSSEHLAEIGKGNDIVAPDGSVLKSDELRVGSYKGGNFLVLDLPSNDYLHNIECNKQLLEPLEEISSTLGFDFITHFTPPDVIETPAYRKFMRSVRAKKHLAVNESNTFWSNKWMHKLQHDLNMIDAEVFPNLCSTYDYSPRAYLSETTAWPEPGESVAMEPTSSGTKYIFQFQPKKTYSREAEVVDDEEDSDSEQCDDDGPLDEKHKVNVNRTKEYPRIVFLGTGSSFPGVLKNTTSILVHTSPDAAILLDCGEGTAGQIIRLYGDQSEQIFRKIKGVFISHMHGDHHVGFMEFLRMRTKFMPDDHTPLVVLAPMEPFGPLLQFYEENFGNVLSQCTCIDNADMVKDNSVLSDEQRTLLNIIGLSICRTVHTDSSYAISIRAEKLPSNGTNAEFKITFSGDAVPSDDLEELGRNSSVLIHEATLEDSLTNSARSKKHSTISQAIEHGRKMNADFTLLTHFSQRYQTLPPIPDELMTKNVSIAFDNMEIVPSDLPKLNDVYYKLRSAFKDEVIRVERRSKRYKEIDDMRGKSNID